MSIVSIGLGDIRETTARLSIRGHARGEIFVAASVSAWLFVRTSTLPARIPWEWESLDFKDLQFY